MSRSSSSRSVSNQRKQAGYGLAEQLDERAAEAAEEHRAERGIFHGPDEQFDARRHHALDQGAGELFAQPRGKVSVGLTQFPAIAQIEPHAADVTLVQERRSHGLQGHGEADLVGNSERLVFARDDGGARQGKTARREEGLDLLDREPPRSPSPRALEHRPDGCLIELGCGHRYAFGPPAPLCVGRGLCDRHHAGFRESIARNRSELGRGASRTHDRRDDGLALRVRRPSDDGGRDGGRFGHERRHVKDQHAVDAGIGEQNRQRALVLFC
jgi:hypothetical protein